MILSSALPALRGKMVQIYNPLPDFPPVRKDPSSMSILYLGGDAWTKGFDVFVQASKRLLERAPRPKFIVARNLRRQASASLVALNLRYPGVYELVGEIDSALLAKHHGSCRGLVFPSLSEEPLPYVVLESLLAGTIPVASRVGGVPEAVAGTFAERMLFDAGDVEGCVERLGHLLSMSDAAVTEVGRQLREAVLQRFSYEATVACFQECLA